MSRYDQYHRRRNGHDRQQICRSSAGANDTSKCGHRLHGAAFAFWRVGCALRARFTGVRWRPATEGAPDTALPFHAPTRLRNPIPLYGLADLAITARSARFFHEELKEHAYMAVERSMTRDCKLNPSCPSVCGQLSLTLAQLGGMLLGMEVKDDPVCGTHHRGRQHGPPFVPLAGLEPARRHGWTALARRIG